MRYFQVLMETLVGDIVCGEVDIDGEYVELPDTIEPNEERELGFVVKEMDEQGVITDTIYGLTLDEIKKEYSADNGWQNNNW